MVEHIDKPSIGPTIYSFSLPRSNSRRRKSSLGFHRQDHPILLPLHNGQLCFFFFNRFRMYPHGESNTNLRFRKPAHDPLCYEGLKQLPEFMPSPEWYPTMHGPFLEPVEETVESHHHVFSVKLFTVSAEGCCPTLRYVVYCIHALGKCFYALRRPVKKVPGPGARFIRAGKFISPATLN